MGELTVDGFSVRGYRPGDAAALTAMYNAIETAAGGHPGHTTDETHAALAGTVTDLDADVRLVFAPDGALAAAGAVASPPVGGFRVDLYGGVAPAWTGRGIGHRLFAWQLARAAEIHRTVAPDAEWVVDAGAHLTDTRATRLFERFGFTAARYFVEMLAPTRTDLDASLPAGLRVVGYEAGRERAVYDAHMEAFSDHWGYQKRDIGAWTAYTTRSDTFRPDLSRVAYDGDEIAGYVLAYDDADPDRAYIGQVGTRRPWRRRGLAGALLADVLAAAAKTGKGHVYLGVDADSPTGAVGVYERAGFVVESRSVDYRKPLG